MNENNLLLEPRELYEINGVQKAGSFRGYATDSRWYGCREQFANDFTDTTPHLYFSIPTDGAELNPAERVANFVRKTEQVLDFPVLKEGETAAYSKDCYYDYSQFAKTSRNYAMWVKPSRFWRECTMKRSLFTIFLRCGLNYDVAADNYEYALWSCDHSISTNKAVQRFLFGYTKFIKTDTSEGVGSTGWVQVFQNKSDPNICKKLIWAGPKKQERFLMAQGSIWG